MKDWEWKIVQEIQAQEGIAVKKGAKDKCQFISGRWADITNEYIALDQYKRLMNIGGKHSFFTSGFGHPKAWEWNNDESYREGFKDIDDQTQRSR